MIEQMIQDSLAPGAPYDPGLKPADAVSRQDWQEIAEDIVARARRLAGQPAFGLGEAEVSVHYHRPLGTFAALIRTRLGLPPDPALEAL
ncbi:hypothetical protein [Poseidonocella sp. HB161398]|uniref:hypothetical protein n=1 Tax=Poseidonocella sp. HB161398 TaxID=2320855 RepID=UPI0011090362|nr:hypothetical protein [Poseidonocella sp. HB161398]